MNEKNMALAEGLVSARYIKQATDARRKREGLVTTLLSQRRLPKEGWDDNQIQLLLRDLALMDSNNFVDNVGVGEREGRVYSRLVEARYSGMTHGVGRSGDLTAEQPKAAGSSILSKLTHLMAAQALKLAGLSNVTSVVVLPVATGMSITLCLMGLSLSRPGRRKVVWPRVDQKTCLKAMLALGLEPIIIKNHTEGDEVVADHDQIEAAIAEHGAENILAVVITTSCFAPRAPDDVVLVAEMCKRTAVPLLVNNAYGCQSDVVMKALTRAATRGRVDGIVQSTDKNFMVPVGGAILATCTNFDDLSAKVASLYPGRASSSAMQDLFITLLSMGEDGYLRLLSERSEVMEYLTDKVGAVAVKHGERLLVTPRNRISMGLTLGSFERKEASTAWDAGGVAAARAELSALGAMLFARSVSGTRVVTCVKEETLGGIKFAGYGAHMDDYPTTYLSFACAVGITRQEVDTFASRLDKTLKELRSKLEKSTRSNASSTLDASSTAGSVGSPRGRGTQGSADAGSVTSL